MIFKLLRPFTDENPKARVRLMSNHPHFLWTDLFRGRKSPEETRMEALRTNALFSTLGTRQLRHLAGIVYERVYQPGEAVFHQGDRGFGVYVIAEGRIAIKTEAQGRELLVTTLEKGSFFGELALVEPENIRTATAAAVERAVLIGFFKADLMELVGSKPAIGVAILLQLAAVLGRRLAETTERITQLARPRDRAEAV